MITTHKELLKLHGKKITCKIENVDITDAKICIEGNNVYVCQNIKSGTRCKDTLGYAYSWIISYGNYINNDNDCKDIELVEDIQKCFTRENQIKKIEEKMKDLTPAIINDAEETWQKFTDAWNALYHKAEKIKSKKSLETLTAKIKEL